MSPPTLILVFLSIAVVASVGLVGGFLLGHDFDGDHGFDADGTGAVFSSRVLGTFALGLGAAGAIATSGGLSASAALAVGVGCGGVLAGATFAFFALLTSQQSSMLVATSELVGCLGVVVTSIGQDRVGEVGVTRAGRLANFLARAQSGTAISRGKAVRVVRVAGSLLFVEESSPFSSDEPRALNRC